METIATKAGLDVTNKKFTEHSLPMTTVTKLRKSGATNREFIATRGQKVNKAYDALDLDDHWDL